MTGLDAKLQRDRTQRNTGDQGALEDKEEILQLFVNQIVQFPSVCIKSIFVLKKTCWEFNWESLRREIRKAISPLPTPYTQKKKVLG